MVAGRGRCWPDGELRVGRAIAVDMPILGVSLLFIEAEYATAGLHDVVHEDVDDNLEDESRARHAGVDCVAIPIELVVGVEDYKGV